MKMFKIAAILMTSTMMIQPLAAQENSSETSQQDETAQEAAIDPVIVENFNAAITEFGNAQTLQANGDHQGALTSLDSVITPVEAMLAADPSNTGNYAFLANLFMMKAASYSALSQLDGIISSYESAFPLWKKALEATPENAVIRNAYGDVAVTLGNNSLNKQDNAAATGYYQTAIETGKAGVAANADDAKSLNALFSGLVGMNLVSGEQSYLDEAKTIAQQLHDKGVASPANQQSVDNLLGLNAAPAQ